MGGSATLHKMLIQQTSRHLQDYFCRGSLTSKLTSACFHASCLLGQEVAPKLSGLVRVSGLRLKPYKCSFLQVFVVKQPSTNFKKSTGTSMLSTGLTAVPKPPNVLIYHPDKDSTNEGFLRVKQSLELCLTPERYVIYPLGLDDILQYSPWKENCKLLVIPPTTQSGPCGSHDHSSELSPRVVEEISRYTQSGGSILSLHSHLNSFFGFPFSHFSKAGETDNVKPEDEHCTVEVCEELQKYQFPSLVSSSSRNYALGNVFLDVPLSDSVVENVDVAFLVNKLKWDEANNNQSNNKRQDIPSRIQPSNRSNLLVSADVVPCVRKVVFKNEGRATLANIDLLPVLPTGIELESLMHLSRGVAQRKQLLSSLLSWFGMECSKEKLPDLSHTYLLCSDKCRDVFLCSLEFVHSDSVIPGQEVSLHLVSNDFSKGTPVDDLPRPSNSELTIITRPAPWQLKMLPFSSVVYFAELKTREIGKTVLHTPVITSTMLPFTGNLAFCQALSSEMGVVWLAAQQTQGKGRSGNAWISPLGSMMFTLPLPLSPVSRLAHHLPLLQHMVGVAVVHGIRTLPGYEGVPLRIKWPNDIYHEGRVKLGGILVSCVTVDKICMAVVGCGVNICNAHPTISINNSIALFNKETGASLPPLSVEQTLARTFNWLEKLLSLYEVEGEKPILQLYYKYWLHSGSEVMLSGYEEEKATVVGIDKYGYLQVLRKSGETVSLQPDGNSFDITKGLIIMKSK